jgi:hypothetical protein
MRQHSPFLLYGVVRLLFSLQIVLVTQSLIPHIYRTRTLPNSDLSALNVIMKAAGIA